MGNLIETKKDFLSNEQNVINRYLEFIDVKDNTIDTYKNGLKMFFMYLQGKGVKNPTRQDIIDFRESLKNGHSLSTVNTYLISIRNFFKWLEYENIYKDITKNIKGVCVSREHKREALTEQQANLVLQNSKNNKEKLIFLLGVCCGCRANEICNIRLEDFVSKGDKTLLYLLGKDRDGKVDYVVVDNELYDFIKKYIEEYNIKDYLITSDYKNDGSKVTNKTIRYIIKQMLRRVGIDSELYSCHSLRHTFATINLLDGKDIREVSKALRHKNIATTEIYAHDIEQRNNKCFNGISERFVNI